MQGDRIHRAVALFLVLGFTCLSGVSLAQPQALVDQFERRSHTLDGFTLNYRLFVPADYEPELSYPLVLALHGSGERGNDNERHIASHRLATAWADTAAQSRHPTIVVAPQAPGGGDWSSGGVVNPIRPELATTFAILDSLTIEFNIDPDRVYVTGLSMGGFGALEAVMREPDRFAAAIPMSGGGNPIFASNLEEVPLWFVHGESDDQVPPEWSREVVFALEELGREPVFTHCGPYTCSPLSQAEFEAALARRPDLLYTGLPGEGHVIWAPWYDNRRLQDWLFAQHRLLPDAIDLFEPTTSPADSDYTRIEWTGPHNDDLFELWFRPAPGEAWELVQDSLEDDGVTDFFTGDMPDLPLSSVRLMVVDTAGLVYARSQSELFSIDAPGNGVPFVDVQDFQFRSGEEITDTELLLRYQAADVESSTLRASLLYSADGGSTFSLVGELDIQSREMVRELGLDLKDLPNSPSAVLRLEVADNEWHVGDQTPSFSKQTPRMSSTAFEHTMGRSDGTIVIHFVEPSELTGHRYRVTFALNPGQEKRYTVRDLDLDLDVLSDIPVNDAESPAFDGIRLTINDVQRSSMDHLRSGWSDSTVTLEVNVTAPRVNVGGETRDLLATPSDYEMRIFADVVDTSSTLFGFPAMDVRFTLENLTNGGPRDILFGDPDGNGYPDRGENFYLIEEDEDGVPFPSWLFTFSGVGDVVKPTPGDKFTLITRKPISEGDVFEFFGATNVSAESDDLPGSFELGQNFPNPFSSATTISYTLSAPRRVILTLHDALGRTVREVFDQPVAAGTHRTLIDASGLASGVYFYRMKTDESVETRRMVVVR